MLKTLLLTILAVLGPHAGALAEPLRIASVETVPWAFVDAGSGQPAGVFPDVADELHRRTGLDFDLMLLPFARIVPELRAGRLDCAVMVWSDSAEAYAVRGQVVASHAVGVLPASRLGPRTIQGLAGLSVSALRGLRFPEPFESDPAILKDRDPDYLTALNKLVQGRVDAVAGSIPTIRHVAASAGLDGYLGDPIVLEIMHIVFQFSKRSKHLDRMPRIEEALDAMRADGTLERINRDRYGR